MMLGMKSAASGGAPHSMQPPPLSGRSRAWSDQGGGRRGVVLARQRGWGLRIALALHPSRHIHTYIHTYIHTGCRPPGAGPPPIKAYTYIHTYIQGGTGCRPPGAGPPPITAHGAKRPGAATAAVLIREVGGRLHKVASALTRGSRSLIPTSRAIAIANASRRNGAGQYAARVRGGAPVAIF